MFQKGTKTQKEEKGKKRGKEIMPIYAYECSEHGEFEKIQKLNCKRFTSCPQCNEVAMKTMPLVAINKKSKVGHTRQELFDNLAKEGNGGKDWRHYDSYYHHATGNEDALNTPLT